MQFSPDEQREKASQTFQCLDLLGKTELKQLEDIFLQYQLNNLAIGKLKGIAETQNFIEPGNLNYSTIGNIQKEVVASGSNIEKFI